jgi:FkbM family methyltransferase
MRTASQALLLRLYAIARRTGFLETAVGRWVFARAYSVYKYRFEASEIDALQRFVRPGAYVIDVGANIGFFTTRFARWVSRGGRVLAIEPEALNLERLCRTLKDECLDQMVDVIPAAATNKSGMAFLEINPNHPGDHRLGSRGRTIESVTLDGLIAARGWTPVSLVKIDVQGAEAGVIAGAREILTRFRPALYVEIDDRNLRSYDSSATELLKTLSEFGYVPYHILRWNGALSLLDPREMLRQAETEYADVLFIVP